MEMSSLYLENTQYEDGEDRPSWKITYKAGERKLRLHMGPRRWSVNSSTRLQVLNHGQRCARGAGMEKTNGVTQRLSGAHGGQGEPGGGSRE